MPHDESWFSLVPAFMQAQKWLQEKLGLTYLAKTRPTLQYVAAAILVAVIAILMVLWARRKWKKTEAALVPEARFSASNFFEILTQTTLGVMRDIIGPNAREFLPLIGTLAVFIFFSNLMGLIPGFLPPTTNLNVTAGCALIVFLWYHGYGIRENWRHYVHHAEHHGGVSGGQKFVLFPVMAVGKYVSHFANPVGAWWGWILAPLMFPIELISHLARPLSLALRLLGNMTGDHAVLAVFLGLVPLLVPLPFFVLGFLVSIIQTLVFCLLSTVYIALAVTHEES